MPTYVYWCKSCSNEIEYVHGFNDKPELVCDECEYETPMVKVLGRGMYIAAAALPNKRHGVRAANAREAELNADLPAYKRMRRAGLQPKGTKGAAELERREPSDQFDIDHELIMRRHGASRAQIEDTKAELVSAGVIKDTP